MNATKSTTGFDWSNVKRFNFTYAITGGAWLEDSMGYVSWYAWTEILRHKSKEWIDAQLKKQGWMTGCWIDVESEVSK